MAHLNSDLRPCCKNCIYLGFCDDGNASWYYCGFYGGCGYDSTSNKIVDRVVSIVFEKREGDIIPRFYEVSASSVCENSLNRKRIIQIVNDYVPYEYRLPLIHIISSYGKE